MKTKLALLLLLSTTSFVFADETRLFGNMLGADSSQSYSATNLDDGPLSAAFSGAHGHVAGSVSHGAANIDGALFGDYQHNKYDSGTFTGQWDDTITVMPSDPALLGTGGTLRITYHLKGSVSIHNCALTSPCSYYLSVDGDEKSCFYYYNGTFSGTPISDLSDFVENLGFTFGTPRTWQTQLSTGGNANPVNANSTLTFHTLLTSGNIQILDQSGHPASYRSFSSVSVSAGTNFTSGQSVSGFALTNVAGYQTTAALLDGSVATDTNVTATFIVSPDTNNLISDTLDLSGINTNLYVLQLNYDPIVAALKPGGETNILLLFQNPDTAAFVNAVMGNSDNGASAHFVPGPYVAANDFHLGYFGVDTNLHQAWAVLDHNSVFAVGQPFAPLSLHITSIIPANDFSALTVSGPTNAVALIESSLDLTNWNATTLISLTNATSMTLIDSNSVSAVTNRFFRVHP